MRFRKKSIDKFTCARNYYNVVETPTLEETLEEGYDKSVKEVK